MNERTAQNRLRTIGVTAILAATLGSLLPAARASAQPSPSAGAPPVSAGSPREAVTRFLEAVHAGDMSRAASYLEMEEAPAGADAEGLARELGTVLDRALPVNPETLSEEPDGDEEDGLPPGTDRVGTLDTSRGSVDLLVARVEADSEPSWKFSSGTVALVPRLYGEFGHGALGNLLPGVFFEVSFLHLELWQWCALLLLLLAVYLLSWPLAALTYRIGAGVTRRTRSALDDRILEGLINPFRLLIAVLLFGLGTTLLDLDPDPLRLVRGLLEGLTVVSVAWVVSRLVDQLSEAYESRLTRTGRAALLSLIPLGRKAAKAVVAVLAFLFLLQNLGLNVAGLIAGLGIGGLAVALAAQKTVENLFGGVSIVADQPVRVGDFIKYGDQVGTVEDIGLRSTRIRSLDRTVVSIPNAEFASMKLENFARRDRIRLYTVLGVRYETSPDQMRALIADIRELLLSHAMVDPDPARIRLVGFGACSLDLEIFAYVKTRDWGEFLAVREDIYLRIMDIVERNGSGFAFPSQTTYLRRDEGLNAERRTEAEERIGKLREKREVPLPDFPADARERMDDTVAFPPPDSALAPRE